ncbi:MAG: hypothetical protein ACFN0W_11265, partial [Propionibacterium acidifaciens]
AAAADQLETWGSRVDVPVIRSSQEGGDPASVAFDAAQKAQETHETRPRPMTATDGPSGLDLHVPVTGEQGV